MSTTPSKLVQSVFWPISVWPSFTHVEEHPADDYVEQTTPILGTAVGFWACMIGLIAIWVLNLPILTNLEIEGVQMIARMTHSAGAVEQVLVLFLLVLYATGFWMFYNREGKYPN